MSWLTFFAIFLPMLLHSKSINGSVIQYVNSADDDCTNVECPTVSPCPWDSKPQSSSAEEKEYASDDAGFYIDEDFNALQLQHFDKEPAADVEAAKDSTADGHVRIKRSEPTAAAVPVADHEQLMTTELQRRCCLGMHKCSCLNCAPVPKCGVDEIALEISIGNGQPGNCCTRYNCSAVAYNCTNVAANANVNMEQYFWRSTCKRCSCVNGQELCLNHCQNEYDDENNGGVGGGATNQSCYAETLQKEIANGEQWTESNGCIKCTCNNGDNHCTANLCKPLNCQQTIKLPTECCPICARVDVGSGVDSGVGVGVGVVVPNNTEAVFEQTTTTTKTSQTQTQLTQVTTSTTMATASVVVPVSFSSAEEDADAEMTKRNNQTEADPNEWTSYDIFILATGTVLLNICIAFMAAFIERWATRRKMYLVVPYSETNLSQTTVNSTLTV